MKLRFSAVPVLALVLLAAMIAIATTGTTQTASAQSAPASCKVVIALDKSASIGDNWNIYRNQILDLFGPGGLNRADISLAFWTFSQVGNTSGVNYNAPFNGYVPSNDRGALFNAFRANLPEDPNSILGGQTNYEQGFGYNQGLPNTSSSDITQIRNNATVVALLTDGLPNYPGGLDNNEAAVQAGQSARSKYGAGVKVIGGYISDNADYVPSSLYKVVNGDENIHDNVGPLNFGSLNDFLKGKIPPLCDIPTVDYSIAPVVAANPSHAKPDDQIKFTYTATNTTSDNTTGNSAWKLYDVTIDPSIRNSPLTFKNGVACRTTSGQSYCDSVNSCADILALIGGTGSTCSEVPPGSDKMTKCDGDTSLGSGTYGFKPGENDTDFYPAARCVTIGDVPIGTQVCSILAIANPTGDGKSNRISDAGCTTIAKTPLVQVHGGDVRVGRYFDGDTEDVGASGVYTSTFTIRDKESLKVVPSGRTFGSWVEYGVLAPGPIRSVASLAGYASMSRDSSPNGGYDLPVSDNSCDLNLNKLTFLNSLSDSDDCGHFAGDQGAIPNTVSALKSGTPVDTTAYTSTTPLMIDGNRPGLYTSTTTGSYEIGKESNDITLPKRANATDAKKTFIVYVPNGTVTIAGNIRYADDDYSSIDDIPQMVIIAKNINIKEKVTRIDSWLIANGGGDDGKIDTCTGFAAPFSAKVCQGQLTINGPVMARQLDLWRTKLEASDCVIVSLQDCSDSGAPAEIINLPGTSILWAQNYGVNPSRVQTANTIELPPYY